MHLNLDLFFFRSVVASFITTFSPDNPNYYINKVIQYPNLLSIGFLSVLVLIKEPGNKKNHIKQHIIPLINVFMCEKIESIRRITNIIKKGDTSYIQ